MITLLYISPRFGRGQYYLKFNLRYSCHLQYTLFLNVKYIYVSLFSLKYIYILKLKPSLSFFPFFQGDKCIPNNLVYKVKYVYYVQKFRIK